MADTLAFRARARTIDHLGREQIADCPTAVSELWKNSYDAYARSVALNIHDGSPVIATIADDGHGMNREEFSDRWFVIGTESKANQTVTPAADRNGLNIRTKQGQKGIGRLSSASLGPLLLVVSKRRSYPFVAALIDWRLFENPYLYLMDIEIPIVEFEQKGDLFALLPDLFDKLMGNLWGSTEKTGKERRERLEAAWKQFSKHELATGASESTFSKIEKTVIETAFNEIHFRDWPLWKGECDQGTVLAISDVQFDLAAQLSNFSEDRDSAVTQARQQLFQTLSNFTDPFADEIEREKSQGVMDFSTSVSVFEKGLERKIVREGHPFDLVALKELEHVLEGAVDEHGVFRGRVKAYGEWIPGDVVIPPAVDVPLRSDSRPGPFSIRLGTFEQALDSTSSSPEVFRKLEEQAKLYAGFLVYRNGLRVLPYGREGSDFFRIESRRSKHVGRAFWSLRRLFGRVALRIEDNPNLRDKAGREGLIDNKAAKCFRDLVEYILTTTARDYFGTDSELRRRVIPDRKLEHKKRLAEEARNQQRAKNRKAFRANLAKNSARLASLVVNVKSLAERVKRSSLDTETDILELRHVLQESKQEFSETSVGEAPRNLGALEEQYLSFRQNSRHAKDLLDSLTDTLDGALERVAPRSAKDVVSSELNSNASFLHRRLRAWGQEARKLLDLERERIEALIAERNKLYHAAMAPVAQDAVNGVISLRRASELLDQERLVQDGDNEEIFGPYISALTSLRERIDLVGLAHFSQDQADELREEVDRLHGLAQLGITVEIVGHEIESLEQTVGEGLKAFPQQVRNSAAFEAVRNGHEALIDRLRFLSPLKLSGPRTRSEISGHAIYQYVCGFFKVTLADQRVKLEASPEFLDFSVFEQPARILPVFINLVNNALYWVNQSSSDQKMILLDVVEEKVVIADSGPGVSEEDQKRLFQIFFTRKVRGGRGVGLYLCRTNLAAGGHTIEYSGDKKWSHLGGAAFVIKFRGGRHG